METTFITIHDLSKQARILYSSDSIVDILGHTPDEVVGKSTWDFFHPEEVPVAQRFHSRGVRLDKAAVLAYCQIKNREEDWIGCECCFTIVYDVMVCCTSIYRRGLASQKRAVEAPVVRKLFAASPEDPRYHMLTHLSNKFKQDPPETHEPRAALFLNRFTRTLTIMYATAGIEQIIGIPADQMKGRSFYFCIQENCLEDAVRCLESAKGNDSIAYLRFWYRDPRQDDVPETDSSASEADTDEDMTDVSASDADTERNTPVPDTPLGQSSSRDASGSNSSVPNEHGAAAAAAHEHTSPQISHASNDRTAVSTPSSTRHDPIELEAVISCTSDGLVVCLRRARPTLPPSAQPQLPNAPNYHGIFAAPWAAEPLYAPALQAPGYQHAPEAQAHAHAHAHAHAQAPGGPPQQAFMQSIREQAIFAWALTGINGSLEQYSRGMPRGEAQPPEGFPVWAPEGQGGRLHENISPGNSGYGSGSSSGHGNGNGHGSGTTKA